MGTPKKCIFTGILLSPCQKEWILYISDKLYTSLKSLTVSDLHTFCPSNVLMNTLGKGALVRYSGNGFLANSLNVYGKASWVHAYTF